MNTVKMKKLLLLLLVLPLLLSGTPNTENKVEMDFFGIWRTFDGDFVQITRNMDFEVTFQRISSKKQLMMKGKLNDTHEGKVEITREYPLMETYTSEYVFSPSKKTLVILQPDGEHAWVLERIQ